MSTARIEISSAIHEETDKYAKAESNAKTVGYRGDNLIPICSAEATDIIRERINKAVSLFEKHNINMPLTETQQYIKQMDDLGRIHIPKEIRKQIFGKADTAGMPMEFFYNSDGTIIMKPL